MLRITTYRSFAGSIHNEVPVKPVWPIALADIFVPQDEVGSMVSQPSARELFGTVVLVAKSGKEGERIHQRAQAPTAAAVPNKPA